MAIIYAKGKLNPNVNGTSSADWIYGDVRENIIHGNGGNDVIYGKGEDDTLFGDAGSDFIQGGWGSDTMTGGLGRDTYAFDFEHGNDVITDFNFAQGDRIVFDSDVEYVSAGTSAEGWAQLNTVSDGSGAAGTITLQNVTLAQWNSYGLFV
jgi:Ca2+-binding RTX toxin-like protein